MKEGEMKIPHLFTCPISLDLFTDPVTLCTGQTYDRPSIEKWLAAGNLTCPITMQKLHDLSLVPNHTLRHLIHQWPQMDHQFDPHFITTIDPLLSLKHSLESPKATFIEKLQALRKIRALSDQTTSTDSFLVQMGFLPLLLQLIFQRVELEIQFCQDYVNFVELGVACVIKLLPFGELECLNMLKEESKFESFVLLFEHGSVMMKQSLCHIVGVISSSLKTRDLCGIIGIDPRFLNRIVCLVKQNSELSEAGIKTISALCCLGSNREKLVQQGLIDGLVTYIVNSERKERSLAAMAMGILEELMGIEIAKEGLIKNPNGVIAVVKMVFRVSSDDDEGSESAINTLMKVCEESLEAREKAIVGGVLTQLLLLLQSQCSGRTKTTATKLLKLL